ncbi:AAA family ATPase [Maridesulfovibrio ferrireducens]|uniref:ATP-binding hybrid sensor histidine kinase/response regulator n=1 Tax=Maridesulfovibrio ferrireducens TaxID=246191 RepID=UPI001A2553F4|nr:AAA family ATPase [Maridesulfovibrio ferrireducens]MBI9111989.1 AAA family ATPase [Maridesulfovibrio ferrireducens]
MIDLVGYEKVGPLFKEDELSLCRAVRDYDGSTVLIKYPTSKFPSHKLLSEIKNEYATSLEIGKQGAIYPIALHQTDNSLALILEDKGYSLLNNFIINTDIDLKLKILLAIKALTALNCVHSKGFLHRNVKPDCFAVSRDMHEVVMTGLQRCSRFPDSASGITIGLVSDNFLPYISPEQSGRISEESDHRSDFYSFGISLYELFTGSLPFSAEDASELIHCHLAQEPPVPDMINPEIPEQLSAVILKLLAKNPNDRYQSAHGIKQDLKICLKICEKSFLPEGFKAGDKDISDTFTLSRRLFGRKREKHLLLKAFKKSALGSCEVVMVKGEPGSGKTSLINDIHKQVDEARGEFISGKFDQFKRNIPYSALIQAFQKLIRKRLTNSTPVINAWGKCIIKVLGSNAGLITEVIPELELLIGPQPPPAKLPLTEARSRFNLVFKNFIKIFPNLDHPLVLFIDDLQWADASTTALITELIADKETTHLLFIGAYRDSQSLNSDVRDMLTGPPNIITIPLNRLKQQHVLGFISRTFRTERSRASELAKLIFNRTGGNPLFVREYIRNLYRAELIKFNYEKTRWDWDVKAIRKISMDGNIVELMAEKIKNLAPDDQKILKTASCIGGKFDMNTLIAVTDLSKEEIVSFLNIALRNGLLLSSEESPEGADLISSDLKWTPQLSFMHDRVQQAAYSMLTKQEKTALHLKIGRNMLRIFDDSKIEEIIFDVAMQFKESLSELTEEDERYQVSAIFRRAGKKAKRSSAFDLAANYFATGIQLLNQDCWIKNYALTFDMHLDWLECEYLNDGTKHAEEIFTTILEKAANKHDILKIKLTKIMRYTNQSRYQDAVKMALELLTLFSMNLPEHPGKFARISELLKTRTLLHNKSVEDLYNLPKMKDPEQLEIMKLLMHIITPAYMYNKQLVFFIVLKMLRLSLKYGNAPSSAFGYMFYAMFLAAKDFSFEKSKKYTQLAVGLNKQFGNNELDTKINMLRGCAHDHWHVPIAQNIRTLETAFQSGQLNGDATYGRYASYFAVYYKFLQGSSLSDVRTNADKYLNFLQNTPNQFTTGVLQLIKQMSKSFEGTTHTPGFLNDESFHEKELIGMAKNNGSEVIEYWAKISKIITLSFFGYNQQALEKIENIQKNIEKYLFGMLNVPIFHFFSVINMTALYNDSSVPKQKTFKKRIKNSLAKLKIWEQNCPENFSHLFLLASAEHHSLTGQSSSALRLYEEAIRTSIRNGFNNFAALSCELAAKFHFTIGSKRTGISLIDEACEHYKNWGASAKVNQLITDYHSLPEEFTPSLMETKSEQACCKTKSSYSLDLSAVMKASLAISGEIVLEQLLDKLMRIVIENAGAQKASLLLNNKNTLELVAHAEVSKHGISTQVKSTPKASSYCESIVNYVFRSKDNIVLRDASSQGPFIIDSYIIKHSPKSVLAMPIINQQVMRGVLYLENNLSPGVFTEERLEVLNLLCSQAAISIQNASLYSDLRESETQYRTLLESINVGVYRAEASLEGKLIRGNRALAKMFGYSDWDSFHMTPIKSLFIHQENHYSILNELLSGKSVRDKEVQMQKTDGTPIWVNITASLYLDENSKTKWMEGVIEDITEQKKTRELERAKVAADAANKAKSDFLASMSHEIRTPMNAILGMADLLWESRLSKAQKNYVKIFKNAGENLLLLINDILDLSKIEAGQITLEKIDFELEDIFEEIGSIFALRAQSKGIDLSWYIAPELPKIINGDPTRIRQVLVNLVGNALKFTDQGSVTYEASITETGMLKIIIKDTGIGIPDSKMNQIFDTFSQADSSTTRTFGGTGLGLSICMQMVKCMGGGLFVSSQKDQGSSFSFTMQLTFPQNQHKSLPLNGISILLIDKNYPSRKYLKNALTDLGASVSVAETMNQATTTAAELSLAKSSRKALIIGEPAWDANSFDVLRTLKKDLCKGWSLIMLIEAKPVPRATVRARQLGASYIHKPVSPRSIANEINESDSDKKIIEDLNDFDLNFENETNRTDSFREKEASILLIEDSEDNRRVVDLYLKESPYQITMTENGKEGLEKYILGNYDLVLMDIQMPVMDGYEATKAIRQFELDNKKKITPILALTANAFLEDAQKCINCGCTDHLAKPIKKKKLISILEDYLEK